MYFAADDRCALLKNSDWLKYFLISDDALISPPAISYLTLWGHQDWLLSQQQ